MTLESIWERNKLEIMEFNMNLMEFNIINMEFTTNSSSFFGNKLVNIPTFQTQNEQM